MDDPVDLTTPDGAADLMRTSRSQAEWDANSSKVRAANGGNYPPFWYETIVASGLNTQTQLKNAWEAV